MVLPVKLSEVAEEMALQGEEMRMYLNRRTGEMVLVTSDDERLQEDPDALEHAPQWQQESFPKAREALESEDYLPLPDQFDIHEWAIMEAYVETIQIDRDYDRLDRAIHGKRAFRYFKDALHDMGLFEEWMAFRQNALENIAAEWFDENSVPYVRD